MLYPTQDSLFNVYLNQKLQLNGTELLSVSDKCVKLIGSDVLSTTSALLHTKPQPTGY